MIAAMEKKSHTKKAFNFIFSKLKKIFTHNLFSIFSRLALFFFNTYFNKIWLRKNTEIKIMRI